MVSNVVVGTSNTDIVTVPALKTYAVVLVNFCNTSGTGDETVSLWCVPSGGSASDTTAVWKGSLIEALQTRKFDGKFLMAAGDKLIALSANGTITATISYIEI